MTNQCPYCEREFKQMTDYPLVFVNEIAKATQSISQFNYPLIRQYEKQLTEQKATILQHIEPYLNRLETLVGKEVPPNQLFPEFPKFRELIDPFCVNKPAFYIPDTDFYLGFEDEDTGFETRNTHIIIQAKEPCEQTWIHGITYLGTIHYEGRLKIPQ